MRAARWGTTLKPRAASAVLTSSVRSMPCFGDAVTVTVDPYGRAATFCSIPFTGMIS